MSNQLHVQKDFVNAVAKSDVTTGLARLLDVFWNPDRMALPVLRLETRPVKKVFTEVACERGGLVLVPVSTNLVVEDSTAKHIAEHVETGVKGYEGKSVWILPPVMNLPKPGDLDSAKKKEIKLEVLWCVRKMPKVYTKVDGKDVSWL